MCFVLTHGYKERFSDTCCNFIKAKWTATALQ
jgi:hypothetical protein